MNTELKQAKELHAEAAEMLRQSRQMHDLTMSNQRSLVYALSCLVPKHMVTMTATDSFTLKLAENVAEQIADNARCVQEAIEKREAYDIVHAINVLAMANTDVLLVFTEFRAGYNMFEVQVYGLGNEANTGLFMGEVDLTAVDALQVLLHIESNVTELIIEAREEAEAKAEVEL